MPSASASTPATGIQVHGGSQPGFESILTDTALAFVADLERRFGSRIDECLRERRARCESGVPLDFLPETRAIRDATWQIAPPPHDLTRRLVEITGPVDRKMIINALNSGADVYMADFEDATSPTWANLIAGQRNLADAVRRDIDFVDPATSKTYRLGDKLATLVVRPRGLHLPEAHLVIDGRPAHGSLVDFGLFFFHNAWALIAGGTAPYFYLPKLESHNEARLWNDVFVIAQNTLGIRQGTIRATVLIETLPAAFEMDEILFELRGHAAGLNCGRWDFIFSHIKTRRDDPAAVFPDRSAIGMTQPFMRAYSRLAIQTCHRRGAHAMGGMSAYIPVRDASANDVALAQVRADKEREAGDGHDGTWVAHPGLVSIARDAFTNRITGDHQIGRRDLPRIVADRNALLELPAGSRTEEGLRHNARVGIQYIDAWLRGQGAVPLYNLMEDAATAEISRAQVWQWVHHEASLDDGRIVSPALVEECISMEVERLSETLGPDRIASREFTDARALFTRLALGDDLEEFLTIPAYELLLAAGS